MLLKFTDRKIGRECSLLFKSSIIRMISTNDQSHENGFDPVNCGSSSSNNSSRFINLDRVRSSLAKVNSFAKKRLNDKFTPVAVFEITFDGNSNYRNLSLRELLSYVTDEAEEIDNQLPPKVSSKDLVNQSELVMKNQAGFASQPNHQPQNFSQVSRHDPISGQQQMTLRDLYRLDYLFNLNDEKSLLVRRHAVLFAMDPVRAVVMSKRLLILAPEENDPLVELIDQFMKEWTQNHANSTAVSSAQHHSNEDVATSAPTDVPNYYLPPDRSISFEAHAYEALLTVVKSVEFQEYDEVKAEVRELLAVFQSGSLLSVDVQEHMRTLKNKLSMVISRVSSSQRVLHDIASDDEELALMNLTVLRNKPSLYNYPLSSEILSTHDDTQELLEAYLIDFNSLASKLKYLKAQIQSAEESVALRLDTSRNELLIADTGLAVVGCSIAFSAYIAGVFGMNLDNESTLPEINGLFPVVFGVSLALIPLMTRSVFSYLTRRGVLPQRMNMKKKELNVPVSNETKRPPVEYW